MLTRHWALERRAARTLRVRYLHADIDAIERTAIIRDLRKGVFDVLVGINLLREGLDIPETSLVAILDADKEGYLRSHVSLIQTIGSSASCSRSRSSFYPPEMQQYTRGLAEVGANVFGVGDSARRALPDTLKPYLHDSLQVPRWARHGLVETTPVHREANPLPRQGDALRGT